MSTYKLAQALSVLRAGMAQMLDEDGVIVTDVAAEMPDEAAAVDDALRRVVRRAQEADALCEAAGRQADALSLRAKRFDQQSKDCRAIILSAMEALGEKNKVFPEATISVRETPGAVIITDESALPPDYIRTKTEPDKALIRQALKDDYTVKGAEMSNARPALTLRSN